MLLLNKLILQHHHEIKLHKWYENCYQDYEIKAKYYRFNELAGYASENITINEDGDYVIDLILFPDFGEEEEILNESEIDINGIIDEESVWDKILFGGFIALFIKAIIVLISMIVVLIILRNVYKKFKKISEKAERDDEKDLSDEVLDFIAAKQITTQKEIRSKFFSSEAMISLILTELEHKGKIEKIKKGRGNIIKMLGNH